MSLPTVIGMNSASPIRRGSSLVDQVVQRIGQDIISGKYPPESGLPNETEWCEQLKISRSVLREALRVLVSKNLLSIKVKLGGRIRDQSEWNLLDPDILFWRSQGEDQLNFARELFELRRFVEPTAAGLAAERIKPSHLEALKSACQGMESAGENTDLFLEPDHLFHRTLLAAVGNSLFQGLAQSIFVALEMTLRMSMDAPKGQQQSVPLHWNVVNALSKRDPVAAREAMTRLIDASERDVAEALATLKRKARKASASARKLRSVT